MGQQKKTKSNYLNVGCGKRFDPSWTNIDILPVDPGVLHYDVTRGFPFDDNTMEVVYHSHVLEHIPKKDVGKFMKECFRVLKPGGIIRVAVPDLEQIVRNYLKLLEENLSSPTKESKVNYEWMMMEMYDQVAREQPGGEMIKYLEEGDLDKEFVLSRQGEEVRPYLFKSRKKSSPGDKLAKFNKMSFRVKWAIIKSVFEDLFHKILPGNKYYQIGKFRKGGEIHKWMYDRYSLGQLLEFSGFVDIKEQDAFSGNIPDWESFTLDGAKGMIFKPDSLFMEAVKPYHS